MSKTGTKEWATQNKNINHGCKNGCLYCISGDTLILMADGNLKVIKDIKIGEKIFGLQRVGKELRLTEADVLNHWKTKQQAYKITLEDGTVLISSANHRWLSDRGWKFTSGKSYGRHLETLPRLTLNNSIRGINIPEKKLKRLPNWEKRNTPLVKSFNETSLYMRGYLNGVIRGDGHFAIHQYNNRGRGVERQYQFRLSMKDREPIDFSKKYLQYYGIETFDCLHEGLYTIRTSKRCHRKRMQRIMNWNDSPQFMRGFISGIFDAEGSSDEGRTLRISNKNSEVLDDISRCLSYFDFDHVQDITKINGVISLRVRGGTEEYLRFFQIFEPKIKRKFRFTNIAIHNHFGIESIKKIGSRTLYDITTSTENFIANGMVSHNCYARANALRFKQIKTPEEWTQMRLYDQKDNPHKVKGRIMFPSSHDLFPEYIEETLAFLNKWLGQGNEFLIVSKPRLEVIDRLTKELEPYKEQITFRFTIGSSDNAVLKFWEPDAPTFQERLSSLKLAFERGYKTSVSCEPFFDKTIYTLGEVFSPYVTDTIWIGKLNGVNQRVDMSKWSKDDFKHLTMLETWQTDEVIWALYEHYQHNPKIKWKDSIKKVLNLPEEPIG